jgi:hypothetical protein
MSAADYIYQDFIAIGGMTSPGYADVAGAGSPRKWDIRAGYAISGATVVYGGKDLSKFSVTIYMAEDDDLDDWFDFATMLGKETKSRAGQAFDIVHPFLITAPLNIKSVCVEDISQLTQDPTGLWKATIKFIEYRRPKIILAKPDSATPDVPAASPVATDKADLQTQALMAQINAAKNG